MSETVFISLLYTTYKLLLEQNLIVALHFLDNMLSPIYYSKKSIIV